MSFAAGGDDGGADVTGVRLHPGRAEDPGRPVAVRQNEGTAGQGGGSRNTRYQHGRTFENIF